MGECPEWQRELTVNQPSYDFEGSSPSSPTSLRLLRKRRLPRRSPTGEGGLSASYGAASHPAKNIENNSMQSTRGRAASYGSASVTGKATPGRYSFSGR